MMTIEKSCYTCLYMATHENCDNCLRTKEDYQKGATDGPFRYQNYVESDPLAILTRLHDLQKIGKHCITLGPGEADIYTTSTPEATSKHLHYVAEQCGYMCGNLQHDKSTGRKTLTIHKDCGPFRMEWENDKLVLIIQGDKKPEVFWKIDGVL